MPLEESRMWDLVNAVPNFVTPAWNLLAWSDIGQGWLAIILYQGRIEPQKAPLFKLTGLHFLGLTALHPSHLVGIFSMPFTD